MWLDPEAASALRGALPWWGAYGMAPWIVAAGLGLSTLATAIGIEVAASGLRHLPPDAPWVERARAVHPARSAAAFGALLPAALLADLLWVQRGPLYAPQLTAWLIALLGACTLGCALARSKLHRRIHGRPRRTRDVLRGDLLALALLMPQLVVLVVTAACVRAPADASDALALLGGGLAMGAIAAGASVALLRLLGQVRPASERVQRIAAAAARRRGVPLPPTEELAWDHANAFALPLAGRLLITRAACEVLDDEGLAAVLAHELGHLAESRASRMAHLLGALVLLPVAALPLILPAWGVFGLAALVLFLLLSLLALQRLARRLEQRADAVAHADEAAPGCYARALEALARANLTPAVLRRRHAHPDLYDRMLVAGVAPDYPRPAPPARARAWVAAAAELALSMLLVVALGIAPALVPIFLQGASGAELARAHVVATSGAGSVLALAMALDQEDRDEPALAVSRAAATFEAADPTAPWFHAHLLARAGRCDEAAAFAGAAEARAASAPEWTTELWHQTTQVWPISCPTARTASAP